MWYSLFRVYRLLFNHNDHSSTNYYIYNNPPYNNPPTTVLPTCDCSISGGVAGTVWWLKPEINFSILIEYPLLLLSDDGGQSSNCTIINSHAYDSGYCSFLTHTGTSPQLTSSNIYQMELTYGSNQIFIAATFYQYCS